MHCGPVTVKRRGLTAATGLLVAVLCALATLAVHRVFVGTALGQSVDQALFEQAAALPDSTVRSARSILSLFTVPLVLIACLVPPTIALVRRSPWHAAAAAVLVVGANVTTQLLKTYVFERPDLLSLGAPNSLPSGHTTLAVSLGLALAFVVPAALRAPTAVAGLAGGGLVGLATILVGWHRLSDVVAAVLVCCAWAGLMLTAVVLRPQPREEQGAGEPAARRATTTAHR